VAPKRFGRYEVQREIGEGAMGRVYRCFDPMMKRIVAIKTVKKEFLTRETREEYLRRFRREAQAAGQLSHPNIVSVFDVGEDYFVMEYLEGSSLQVILRDRGQIPVDEAVRMLTPLAEALDYAHRSGVVHRDIKPGNVFVLADGRPKLMDFGVAHLESSAMTAQGHFFGSPSYMAPEQVSGGQVAASADLFSLGVVAYEMMTGHRPFEGASITAIMYRVVNEDAPAPRQWNFDLPAVYDDIFKRALGKNPLERYPDAAALVRALEKREFVPVSDEVLAHLEETLSPSEARALAAAAGKGALTPVPPELMGAVETTDLQTALANEAAARTQAPGRRGLALTGAGLAVGLVALYLARGSAPESPLPPLPSRPGGLRIETDPPGAAVTLDGQGAGVSPVALLTVRPGVHMVRVAREGYAPAGLTLEVRNGEPLLPLRFVMEPLAAKLRVVSDPANAVVRVDGKAVGTTPLEALEVAPGRHEVRLERRGYAAATQTVEGRGGQTVEVSLKLEPDRSTTRAAASAPLIPLPVRRGDLVVMDATVTPPRRIKGEAVAYPKEAERNHFLGTVTVEFVVDEKGRPQELKVVESAGEVLNAAFLEAVKGWEFIPARKNGVPVKVKTQWTQTWK
jgi:eukaryotic-like serine/threonine-protein kinase